MWSSDSSKSNYRIKSVSLGSNEEFARLYNELCNFGYGAGRGMIIEDIRRVNGLLRRVEKDAQLRNVLALILHLIEQILLYVFRDLISKELASRVRGASVNEESVGGSATKSVTRTEVALATLDAHLTSLAIVIVPLWEQEFLLEELSAVFTSIVACGRESAYDVVVSVVVLLALVYQYLQGCVDKGGSKTYSSGSLDFRDSFVCIVLFRGAYVWIKFRQAACPANRCKRKSLETPNQASPFGSHDESPVPEGGVYRRAVRDKSGTVTHFKYEPRVKPPRVRLNSGTTLKFNCLSLGSYDTHHEARNVSQIAGFYYGKEEGHVQLQDGRRYSIPSMSEQEMRLAGKKKAVWVTSRTKAVYADLLEEMKRQRVQLLSPALRTNSHFGGATTDPIESAEIEACVALGTSSTELALLPGADPSLASDQFDWRALLDGFDNFDANNPAPQAKGLDNQMHTGGVTDIVAHLGGCLPQVDGAAAQDLEHREPQLTSHPMHSPHGQVNHLQQLMTCQSNGLDNQMPTGGITGSVAHRGGCLPQVDGAAAQDLEHGEPQLTSPPMESLHGQVKRLQQLVARYEKELQDYVLLNLKLKLKLMESEVQNSDLQCEVENLRSMRHRVA